MSGHKRILIIRFSSLGDIILTTAFIRELKNKFKTAQIDFLTKEYYKDILTPDPDINEILTIDNEAKWKDIYDLSKLLAENKYSLIIDLHKNLRTYFLRILLSAVPFLTYNKRTIRRFLLAKFKINLLKNDVPVAERYLQVLNKLNLSYSDNKPVLFINTHAKHNLAEKINIDQNNDKQLIVIFPASKHFTKTYPKELWVKLIDMIKEDKADIVLAGNEKNISDFITGNVSRIITDITGKLSLSELKALVNVADQVICGDTGPMHIAEALNKNLICLAGPSVKELGFFPLNDNAVILENLGLPCRPCSTVGKSYCPHKHFKCMKDLTPEMIFRQLNL